MINGLLLIVNLFLQNLKRLVLSSKIVLAKRSSPLCYFYLCDGRKASERENFLAINLPPEISFEELNKGKSPFNCVLAMAKLFSSSNI